ncbi:MAG: GEVED domain-containing protein [Planctomycetota bacterium]
MAFGFLSVFRARRVPRVRTGVSRLATRRRWHSIRLESLEPRRLLTAAPLLWMSDNSLGRSDRPADFVSRFENPESWEHTLRAIDSFTLNERILNGTRPVSIDVFRDTIAPVLNRNQVNVSIQSWAANGLGYFREQTGKTEAQLLESHFQWIEDLQNAGLRIRHVSINTVLTRLTPGTPFDASYPMSQRIDDFVRYSSLLRQRFPQMEVGFIDNLLTLGTEPTSIYAQLADLAKPLDHIHYYLPVDKVGLDQGVQWADILALQQFVQDDLGVEFGFLTTSDRGNQSARDWRHDVVFNGVRAYLDQLEQVDGTIQRGPDRFVISAWHAHPAASVPENELVTQADGGQKRVESMSAAIRQVSNLIRGYRDPRGDALVDEVQQVPPVSGDSPWSPDGARRIALGETIVDASETLSGLGWYVNDPGGSQITLAAWIRFQMPRAVHLDRVRVWPATLGDSRQGAFMVRVYASENGAGEVSLANGWREIGSRLVDGQTADHWTIPVSVQDAEHLGIRIEYSGQPETYPVQGLDGVRFYSPHNNWNTRSTMPMPDIRWQRREVVYDDPGASIAKIIADCCDAFGTYQLTVDDPRFEFYLSTLTLKRGQALRETDMPRVTVNVTLTRRDDSNVSFTVPFTFDVSPPLDGGGQSKDRFDYGDNSFYDRGDSDDAVARALLGDLFLGHRVDSELAPQNDHQSRGDDMDTDGDDDDGVIFVRPIVVGTEGGSGVITAHASRVGRLDGWIDFNQDQVFQHPEEHLFGGQSVFINDTLIYYDFSIPSTAATGTTFARFRVSHDGGLRPYDDFPRGPDRVGEVEDYMVRIDAEQDHGEIDIIWQSYRVVSGFEGATAAKILSNGHDAHLRYHLLVNDDRFEFSRSFLRLKPNIWLNHLVESSVTVRVTLVDRQDNSLRYQTDITINVHENGLTQFDFGDAPYRFDTTLHENGPRHQITTLSLGRLVDAEADGQNDFEALGDDTDAGGDDDDGVNLVSTMVAGPNTSIGTFVVDASDAALLDAWIDFNQNGRFDHPEEHLSQNRSGGSIPVTAGRNVLDFVVPAWAVAGSTFARFRLSTAGGLLPNGPADDGEIEDYQWTIKTPDPSTIARFDWPRETFDDAGADALDIEILDHQSGLQVVRQGRVLANGFGAMAPLAVGGSDADDRIGLPGVDPLQEGMLIANLGGGFDQVAFQSSVLVDTSRLPPASLAGVDQWDFRQSAADIVALEAISAFEATQLAQPLLIAMEAADQLQLDGEWVASTPSMNHGEFFHELSSGEFRVQIQNEHEWTNPHDAFDVSRDQRVTASDALRILNAIRRQRGASAGPELPPRDAQNVLDDYYDVSRDNRLTPVDALQVLNQIRRSRRGALGEGEASMHLERMQPDATDDSAFIDSMRVSNDDVDTVLRDHWEWLRREWEAWAAPEKSLEVIAGAKNVGINAAETHGAGNYKNGDDFDIPASILNELADAYQSIRAVNPDFELTIDVLLPAMRVLDA